MCSLAKEEKEELDPPAQRRELLMSYTTTGSKTAEEHLQLHLAQERVLPTECSNGWTRSLLVLATLAIGLTAYANTCITSTQCAEKYGGQGCAPFWNGGALAACSLRFCTVNITNASRASFS